MQPSAIHFLVHSYRALERGETSSAFAGMEQIALIAPEIEHKVYYHVWKLVGGKPDAVAEFGREAFWRRPGVDTPLEVRKKAVGAVIDELVEDHVKKTVLSFERNDSAAALEHMRNLCVLSKELESKVYYHLWRLCHADPSAGHEFGREAFWNLSQVSNGLRRLAVEAAFNEIVPCSAPLAAAKSEKSSVSLPPGAVEVWMPAFHDCGFDPRFSVEGTYYFPLDGDVEKKEFPPIAALEPPPWWQYVLEKVLGKTIAHSVISCLGGKEYLLQRSISAAVALEERWSDVACKGFVQAPSRGSQRYIQGIKLSEHAFFEQIEDLYRQLMPQGDSRGRLFPSELLQVIHAVNHPQDANWLPECARQEGWENLDLCRMSAFVRMDHGLYGTMGIDPKQHGYVNHYDLIQSIKEPAASLKEAVRELRSTLLQIKREGSLPSTREKLTVCLTKLNTCWNQYVHSHELLTEAQMVHGEKNFFTDWYASLQAPMLLSESEYETYIESLVEGESSTLGPSKELIAGRSAMLWHYLQKHKNSLTGMLVAEHQQETGTSSFSDPNPAS